MDYAINPHLDGSRVGLLLPSLNSLSEPEFQWLLNERVSFHSCRMFMKHSTVSDLHGMNAEIVDASRLLSSVPKLDVVAYACTSGTFVDGEDALNTLTSRLEETFGCSCVTTSRSMVDAFKKLGAKRIALATPYPKGITSIEKEFIEGRGYDVVSDICLEKSGDEINKIAHSDIEDLILRANRNDADVIFVSCTDLRATEVIPAVSQLVNKPILTSNLVTLWGIVNAINDPHTTLLVRKKFAEIGLPTSLF